MCRARLLEFEEGGVSMQDYSIKNKVTIVTGGTRGMGFAISKQLLFMGAKVVIVYGNDEEKAIG